MSILKAGRPSNGKRQLTIADLNGDQSMVRLNVDIDKDMHRKLKIQAIQESCTAAEIVRRIINNYLAKSSNTPT